MPSNSAAIAEKIEAGDNLRKPPKIFPGHVQVQSDGQCWREILVRLPQDAITDDLKVPSIWKNIQGNSQTSLRKFDRVFIISYDESWSAEAIVSQATATAVSLSGLRLITLTERTQPLFTDGTYRVEWCGNGYVVKRIKDGQLMTHPVQTIGEAERELSRLYPRNA